MYFPDGEQMKQPRHGRRLKRKGVIAIVATASALVFLGAAGTALYSTGTLSSILHPIADYDTTTGDAVDFVIADGDSGETIANNLAKAKIVKSFDAFYKLILKTEPDPIFIPGVYSMKANMRAKDALAALLDPATRQVNQVTLPEGMLVSKMLPVLASKTKIPLADFEAAVKDPQALGLPKQALNVEGYLFPATYSFSPNMTAVEIIKQMVARTFTALDKAGVPAADQFRVITLASLIQKEAGSTKDMYKVSRVFQNRLIPDLWSTGLLESDATVAYGSGNTHRWETTVAERADTSNVYNTYVHPGPLRAPISNPGEDAIDAALHPVAGKWLFFVAVNLETGETVFSETLAQHEAAVKISQAWWQAHPDYE
ncbi:MAG: hypothetical protein RLZZ600_815 [Actinomycetota bacterium]